MFKRNGKIGRRDLFKTSAGMMGGALLSRETAAEQAAQRNVNTNSSPSALRITDLRVATVVKPGNLERSGDWLWSQMQAHEAARRA
jgi:hypothetical protein